MERGPPLTGSEVMDATNGSHFGGSSKGAKSISRRIATPAFPIRKRVIAGDEPRRAPMQRRMGFHPPSVRRNSSETSAEWMRRKEHEAFDSSEFIRRAQCRAHWTRQPRHGSRNQRSHLSTRLHPPCSHHGSNHMKLSCPHCTQPLEIPETLAGQTLSCPTCKNAFSVPLLLAPLPVATPVATRMTSKSRGSYALAWAIGATVIALAALTLLGYMAAKGKEDPVITRTVPANPRPAEDPDPRSTDRWPRSG